MSTGHDPVTLDQIQALFNVQDQKFSARFDTQDRMMSVIANAVADLHHKFTGMESKMDVMADDLRRFKAIVQANTWDIAVMKGEMTVITTDIGEIKNSVLRIEMRLNVLERPSATEPHPAS